MTVPTKVVADAVEAVVGAAYVAGGLKAASDVLTQLRVVPCPAMPLWKRWRHNMQPNGSRARVQEIMAGLEPLEVRRWCVFARVSMCVCVFVCVCICLCVL